MVSFRLLSAACVVLLSLGLCGGKPQNATRSVLCPKKCKSDKCHNRCARATVLEWSSIASLPNLTHAQRLERFYSFLTPDLPSGAPGVTARVEPVGTFAGRLMVAEYVTILTSPSG